MQEPKRGNDQDFGRFLQANDNTLYQDRVDHEKQLKNEQINALTSVTKLTKQSIAELKKFESDTIKAVNNYKEQLLDKYAKQGLKQAEAEKKISKALNDYIFIQKQKIELETHETRISDIKEEYNIKRKYLEKELKEGKKSRAKVAKEVKALNKKQAAEMRKEGVSEYDIMEATKTLSVKGVKEAIFSKKTASAVANNLINGLKQMFDNTIQTYGTYQAKINTRLQGSGRQWNAVIPGIGGGIENNLKTLIGVNPYIKLQSVMDNVVKATEAGIANNIEQRAFLATVSENIASTFDAFDSNLLRVIRVQQADSTAARLGMEARLTNFLNSYFSDNSYLNNAFDTVSQNLFEATSQLSAEEAVGVEYQIQKWLGSLYSVGFSDTAISKISQALGYLGSGNISALSSDAAMQNLMVMAMNKANLSYGDIMTSGLTASATNSLLKSMVEYLEEIANSDNKVVKSQYAEVFGMTVSDLKAAKNLTSSISDITKASMGYTDSISELYYQMGQLDSRISVAGKLQNLYDNVNYSIGTNIASNPATYALWQITSAIEDLTGGINLPTASVMGNSVDLNTTVTNLMRAGIVGASTLGNIGTIISGISSASSSLLPSSMLFKLGIFGNKAKSVKRGGGLNRRKNLLNQLSTSDYMGNTSGDDYYNQTITSANDQKQKTIEQQKREATDITLNNIHEYLLSVFDPKITAINKMLASIAGYNVSQKTWGSSTFTGTISKDYTATTISVVDPDKNALTNRDLLADIRSNSSDILELLKKVISDSGIKIDYGINVSNQSSIPGMPN